MPAAPGPGSHWGPCYAAGCCSWGVGGGLICWKGCACGVLMMGVLVVLPSSTLVYLVVCGLLAAAFTPSAAVTEPPLGSSAAAAEPPQKHKDCRVLLQTTICCTSWRLSCSVPAPQQRELLRFVTQPSRGLLIWFDNCSLRAHLVAQVGPCMLLASSSSSRKVHPSPLHLHALITPCLLLPCSQQAPVGYMQGQDAGLSCWL
jgi:hypothetical protein